FDPLFLTFARASIAGLLAGALLVVLRQARAPRGGFARPAIFFLGVGVGFSGLCIFSLGVVVGFPLLTALALQHITAARSIVFIGLLPLATAIFGVVRGGERPKPAFWLFSVAGAGAGAG